MCDITMAMMAMGAAKNALQIRSVNQSIESQIESVGVQTNRFDIENAYELNSQAKAANTQGYEAEINARRAAGEAAVRGASLGIRGTTAGELVFAENQIGDYNVSAANAQRRNAGTAFTIGAHNTHAAAKDKVRSLRAQAPTAFESLVSIAAGGLQGYMAGSDISAGMSGVPTGIN